ncbi:Lrp/AsnC family transcriptional regulator [Mycobacterium sp.]|uniref:Lrp/AsnC family transcriptional regulator n=1 Tax=Mycobacterium sp. TaxID=1785 RepID=UPI003D09B055
MSHSDTSKHLVKKLDDLDGQLAHALQIDGRASFATLAAVMGVSDQTVARRYARLRADRTLRVLGLTDPSATGEAQWYLRLRTTPDTAQSIAAALARRLDTSWVMLLGGGTEITCTVRAPWAGNDLLLSTLPRTGRVLEVQAHCRLHQYYGGRRGAVEKLGALRPEQVQALTPTMTPISAALADPSIDAVDRQILDQLSVDGRMRIEQVSAAVSAPSATVRRRLERLRANGTLYFDVELDNRLLRGEAETVLWLKTEPSDLQAVGEALASHPQITFAAACTGPYAIIAHALCPDPGSLYRYLTTSIAALPGLREVTSAPVIRLIKGPGPYPLG